MIKEVLVVYHNWLKVGMLIEILFQDLLYIAEVFDDGIISARSSFSLTENVDRVVRKFNLN